MRRLRYQVAASLDGYIAGPNGEFDWIPMDAKHKKVTVVKTDPAAHIRELKDKPGKDIWLFGGGALFRSLLAAGIVDTVEPAVCPILLGGGIPLLPTPAAQAKLSLTRHKVYQASGIVLLEYAVVR